ncbi:MAG: two-component system phosphate regulon sensor histidine kinase PhoR [Planctomycetota bacterium]
MFPTRFFWKLYISSAALVLLTTAAVGALSVLATERALIEEKETSLRHQCDALAIEATRFFRGELQVDPKELVRTMVGSSPNRVTCIASDGVVLADSHEDAALMDNHLNRPEVQGAIVSEFASATRVSKTVSERMFYVAHVPARVDGEAVGILRLSLSIADIDAQIGALREQILGIALIGLLVALGVGGYLAHRLTLPLTETTRAAQRLRQGDFDTRLTKLPNDEIGILGDALNRLGAELTARMRDSTAEGGQLRAMLAGMVEGVIAVDEEDRVRFSNLAARELLGTPNLNGTLLWEAIRIADMDALLSEARSSDGVARKELVFADDSGRSQVVRAQANQYTVEARAGVVIVLHDITELRRLERVRRDFVANVSHELKTPLTSIRGYVETLIDGAIDDLENNKRFLGKIEDNVQRLNHLVSDLLSLARIEDQEVVIDVEAMDLVPLIQGAMRRHESSALQRNVACELLVPEEPVTVLGDRESLVQVMDNLLDNAIKYTPEGGAVRISVGIEVDQLRFEVQDNGIGIPARDQERVFERFYRVDKARSRAVGGTGLGLSIVKHLVGAMNGSISVESEPGEGTRFVVMLPRG